MQEDPIFSRGVFKVALVVLVAAALGVGAYALAGDGIDIDLPELPEIETTPGDEAAINLEDTTIEEGNFDGANALEPFTSTGLSEAIAKVSDDVGPGQELTRLFINPVQTQFIVRRDDGVEAYSVRADSGDLVREDATISISGNAEITDFAFPLDGVDPAAVDRMISSARKQSGASDFEPTVLSLERAIRSGRRDLEWTINAEGGGRSLLYRANADGSDVRNEGGAGAPIPPAAIDAEKLNECIEKSGNDPERIFACLEQFQ